VNESLLIIEPEDWRYKCIFEEEEQDRMKIAGAIGLEEIRSGLVSSPSESDTSAASFAESFGKEMSATSEKARSEFDAPIPRHIANTNPILVKSDGAEAGNREPQEMPYAKQAGKSDVLTEPTQIVTKTMENISADPIAHGVVEGELSKDAQASSKDPSKLISGEMPVRILPKGVPLVAPPGELKLTVKPKTGEDRKSWE
jgi:hypothetical protein